eukprot:6100336-Prymnesium_polylepis.1
MTTRESHDTTRVPVRARHVRSWRGRCHGRCNAFPVSTASLSRKTPAREPNEPNPNAHPHVLTRTPHTLSHLLTHTPHSHPAPSARLHRLQALVFPEVQPPLTARQQDALALDLMDRALSELNLYSHECSTLALMAEAMAQQRAPT